MTVHAYDDLSILSDEFDAAHTITNWQRLYQVEGWGNDVLETLDINTSRPGQLLMRPYTSTWYAEFRGELTFKLVTGDFVITTYVEPRNRAGTGPPNSHYSLAGIMLRTPRAITNGSPWVAGGENYVFFSLGAAGNPGTYQYETKTTVNSLSNLETPPGPSRAAIQIARIGPHLILLRQNEGGVWAVQRRIYRPDFPPTLQTGLTVYTDWLVCESVGYQYHNQLVLTNGLRLPNDAVLSGCNPDLVAAFDFVRYARPQVPTALLGADLSNGGAVSDAQLLSFLGEPHNIPGGAAAPARLIEPRSESPSGFAMTLELQTNRSYRVQASQGLAEWQTLTNLVSATNRLRFTDATSGESTQKFYRVASP